MIGMKMREENLRQRKAHPVAHHLALGALTTLEKQRLAFAHESHGGDVALDSWSRCRGSQEGDGKHGGEYNGRRDADRKSTRLNSSHGYISYAVFCLKKKKKDMHVAVTRECRT